MTAASPSPRRRLGESARREAILAAAREAFAGASFSAVSVAAIGHAAGASESLVLRYFGTKAALYEAIVGEQIAQLLEAQEDADRELPEGATARERIARSVEVYARFVASAPRGWASTFTHPVGEPVSFTRVRQSLRAGYRRDLYRVTGLPVSADLDRLFIGYLAFVDGVCFVWVQDGCPLGDVPGIVRQALGALAGALTAAGVDPAGLGF